YHGSAVPLINGSFGNTLEFGEFGLTVRLLYKLGYYTRDSGVRYGTLLSGIGSATHAEYRLRWKQPGDEKLTNVPSFVYPIPSGRDNFYNLSEAKVIKGDHIRLQYISLYCNLTPSWLRKISIQRMRLYFNVSNI